MLDFDNLPLIEAAVRASFAVPLHLSYNAVYAVEERLHSTFPVLKEPGHLETAPGVSPSPAAIFPIHLPGAVFCGNETGLSVSLHPQVMVARWQKKFAPLETEYPRYQALRGALWNAVNALRDAVAEDYPEIVVVNMSYTNFLKVSDTGSLASYLSDEAKLGLLAEAEKVRKLEVAWCVGEELDVRFAIEQATAKLGGEICDGYRLTTAAGLRLKDEPNPEAALERVHDRLQDFFLQLISDFAKKQWGLAERADDNDSR